MVRSALRLHPSPVHLGVESCVGPLLSTWFDPSQRHWATRTRKSQDTRDNSPEKFRSDLGMRRAPPTRDAVCQQEMAQRPSDSLWQRRRGRSWRLSLGMKSPRAYPGVPSHQKGRRDPGVGKRTRSASPRHPCLRAHRGAQVGLYETTGHAVEATKEGSWPLKPVVGAAG